MNITNFEPTSEPQYPRFNMRKRHSKRSRHFKQERKEARQLKISIRYSTEQRWVTADEGQGSL